MTLAHDGMIRRTGSNFEIVFHRRYAKPIEKVWAALTQPERIADWLANCTIEPALRVGAAFALHFPVQDYRMKGEIVALDPPRLIAWTWPDPKQPRGQPISGVVRFELAPDGEGCLLTLTNTHLLRPDLENVAAGWHTHLECLQGALDGAPMPWNAENERVHEARYRATVENL